MSAEEILLEADKLRRPTEGRDAVRARWRNQSLTPGAYRLAGIALRKRGVAASMERGFEVEDAVRGGVADDVVISRHSSHKRRLSLFHALHPPFRIPMNGDNVMTGD